MLKYSRVFVVFSTPLLTRINQVTLTLKMLTEKEMLGETAVEKAAETEITFTKKQRKILDVTGKRRLYSRRRCIIWERLTGLRMLWKCARRPRRFLFDGVAEHYRKWKLWADLEPEL